jgi:hypothetical protein
MPGLFPELPDCRIQGLLVTIEFPLGYGPGPDVLVLPERPAGMYQKNLQSFLVHPI